MEVISFKGPLELEYLVSISSFDKNLTPFPHEPKIGFTTNESWEEINLWRSFSSVAPKPTKDEGTNVSLISEFFNAKYCRNLFLVNASATNGLTNS